MIYWHCSPFCFHVQFGFVIETFPSKYDCKYCCLKFKHPCVATFKKSIVGVLRNRMVVAWKHGELGKWGEPKFGKLENNAFLSFLSSLMDGSVLVVTFYLLIQSLVISCALFLEKNDS